jgi:putative ABC transport system substrate-binding protein
MAIPTRRREFILALGGAAVTWPVAARAEQRIARIGFLGLPTADSYHERIEAFRTGLREHGYQEGQNIIIEYRWANNDYDRVPTQLKELIDLKVDVIVTHSTPAALAAKKATSTIPIVFAVVGDAVASGVVTSLARPGGNLTGLTFFGPEVHAKRLEILKEAHPDLTDVGVLLNPSNPMNETILPQIFQVAETLKLRLHQFGARNAEELKSALVAMGAQRVRAFVVIDDPMLFANAPALATLALKNGLSSCGFLDYATTGGLIAYGVDYAVLFRRAATYVDKILKGAKPADLPVERATRFTTILNMATAKALGVTVPQSLLLRADVVIE